MGELERRTYRVSPEAWVESGFILKPAAAGASCRKVSEQMAELVERLLRPMMEQADHWSLIGPFSAAARETAIQACRTGFPLLTFPMLFEEKTLRVKERWRNRERSLGRPQLALAA